MPQPIPNDNISRILKDLVPDQLQGTDRFLDIITWNIKFFNSRDPSRVRMISRIMEELNADIYVLQEIEEGSLEQVTDYLTSVGAGLYKSAYGRTGDDLRVAMMYDMEWVKSKITPTDLFLDENIRVGSGKLAFPRSPFHTQFIARADDGNFDFHLVGLHLKSQRGGGQDQRKKAADRLSKWLLEETVDEDVIMLGDYNNKPSKPEWAGFHRLERDNKLIFGAWNPEGEVSHLSKSGRKSRLDMIVVTPEAKATSTNGTSVIEWNELLENRQSLKFVIDKISDHLPVLSRFYFQDLDTR